MRVKAMVLGVIAALASAAALAGGTWSNVTVASIQPVTSQGAGNSTGYVLVNLSANVSGGASCDSGSTARAVIDVSTTAGAMTAAILQTARMTGNTVSVYGTGTCTVDGGVETVAQVVE